tara:strand:- start:2126 stop:5002 length:2877 start_codon:yes stop_codon:yes gene_type:complete
MVLRISNRSTKPEGGFFPLLNKTPIDLSRYGIYSNINPNENNCLLECFKAKGMDITALYEMVKCQYIPKIKFPIIAEKLNIQLNYTTLHENFEVNKIIRYNKNPDLDQIDITCIYNHYFIREKTEYTRYAVENFEEVCNEKNWKGIVSKRKTGTYKRDSRYFIDSLDVIRLMLKNKDKYFREITGQEMYKLYNFKNLEKEIFDDLSYNATVTDKKKNIGGNLKETKLAAPPAALFNVNETYFFDFETFTENEFHEEYICFTDRHALGFESDDRKSCGQKMLDSICSEHGIDIKKYYKSKYLENKKGKLTDEEKSEIIEYKNHVRLNAHNLSYDWKFIQKFIIEPETIELKSRMILAKGSYKAYGKIITLVFCDTLNMINMPLGKFGKTFNLDCKKELLPYSIYTKENYKKGHLELDICLDALVKHEDPYKKLSKDKIKNLKDEFIQNCKEWNCLRDDMVDIKIYAKKYCFMDCITLKNGWEQFRTWVNEGLELEVNHYYTLASLADSYLNKEGCYDGCYKIGGVPRAFIQKCVVGGRTMTANNAKYHIKKLMDDFDANSLYPSAMERLGRVLGGYLKGAPKVIENFEPEKYDGYFVCVKITKVGKKFKFPLASIHQKGSSRNFTNDVVGATMYLDKIALEDLVNFQKVEYEFINGYYFDEGRNDKIAPTMRHLYNQRVKFKKAKNPIQLVFKEVMNSAYGKSIMKPQEKNIVYKKENELEKFVSYNHNQICQYQRLETYKNPNCKYQEETRFKVEVMKAIDDHFSMPHIGVEVLSMSKRIMNEVMCLAEDLNLRMYYQDTDSIHIMREDVPLLNEGFKEKYDRELIGKTGLHLFSGDFDLDGADTVVSVESFFLGKKCYFDSLEGKGENGEIINGAHVRMKGISQDAMDAKCDELNCSARDIYHKLYYRTDDNSIDIDTKNTDYNIKFNLVANKPKFVRTFNNKIQSKREFFRRVSFN